MRAGRADLNLQVKKYSQLHDQRAQLRAPAQCNTVVHNDNLLLGLEAIVSSRLSESVEINMQWLGKGVNTDAGRQQPNKQVLMWSAVH